MGSTYASGLAETVAEGHIDLTNAVALHLSANHFPPIHHAFVPIALQAIERANDDDWDAFLDLPNGKRLSVSTIIQELHLDAFLDQGDDDGEEEENDAAENIALVCDYLRYGSDHFITRLGARRWRVAIPGRIAPSVYPQRQTARRVVTHAISQIKLPGVPLAPDC